MDLSVCQFNGLSLESPLPPPPPRLKFKKKKKNGEKKGANGAEAHATNQRVASLLIYPYIPWHLCLRTYYCLQLMITVFKYHDEIDKGTIYTAKLPIPAVTTCDYHCDDVVTIL